MVAPYHTSIITKSHYKVGKYRELILLYQVGIKSETQVFVGS